MNWEMVGALGEILGALAVIVTLLYLARQIRQSSREAQRRTLTEEMERGLRAVDMMAEDGEIVDWGARSFSASVESLLPLPGMRWWWDDRKSWFAPEFQVHVDGLIAEMLAVGEGRTEPTEVFRRPAESAPGPADTD